MRLWGLWQGCSSYKVIFLFLQPEPWKEGVNFVMVSFGTPQLLPF